MAGSLAGALAAGLWLLPATRQLDLLNRLGSLGYPTGASVLRYEPGANDTYTDQLRAIGTAVDPNVLGGTLMLAAALTVIQLFAARRPVYPRVMLLLLALPTLAGLLLSFSRASWVGLAAGVLLLGRRSRGTWIAAGAGVLLLIASPIGQRVVTRFVGGLSAADPATALRLGEYRNALTLVSRYPVLGIGFGTSPDIDVSAGVSSVYLLIAEQTGLVGLACFLLAVGLVVRRGLRAVSASSSEDGPAAGIAAGTLAAFAGALVAGLADHYFANQVFPHAVALFWLYAAVLVASVRLIEAASPPAAPSANDGSIGARPAERQAARGPRRSAEY
jgi:O-antigen ligase